MLLCMCYTLKAPRLVDFITNNNFCLVLANENTVTLYIYINCIYVLNKKRNLKWQTSHSGGGRSDNKDQRTSLEVQSYFDRFHPFSLGKLNERNFSIFVEEMRGTKKASSVLFYVRAWLKFLHSFC